MRVCHTFVFIVNDCVLDNLQSLCGNLSSYLGFFFKSRTVFCIFLSPEQYHLGPGGRWILGSSLRRPGVWPRMDAGIAQPRPQPCPMPPRSQAI